MRSQSSVKILLNPEQLFVNHKVNIVSKFQALSDKSLSAKQHKFIEPYHKVQRLDRKSQENLEH